MGDEVYGNDGWLRQALEQRHQRYALTVGAAQSFVLGWGHRRARAVIADLPTAAWQRLSAGDGAKGPRLFDWARVRLNNAHSPAWERWLVARRNLQAPDDPRSIAYYVVFAPGDTSLADIARVIGRRWTIETGVAESKGEVGLGPVRGALVARLAPAHHAGPAGARLPECAPRQRRRPLCRRTDGGEKGGPPTGRQLADLQADPWALLPLTVPEVRRLLWQMLRPPPPDDLFVWAWSRWRRHHQAVAQRCHYKRRFALLTA